MPSDQVDEFMLLSDDDASEESGSDASITESDCESENEEQEIEQLNEDKLPKTLVFKGKTYKDLTDFTLLEGTSFQGTKSPYLPNSTYAVVNHGGKLYRAYLSDSDTGVVIDTKEDDKKAVSGLSVQIKFTEQFAKTSLTVIKGLIAGEKTVKTNNRLWKTIFKGGLMMGSELAESIIEEVAQKRKAKEKKKAVPKVSAVKKDLTQSLLAVPSSSSSTKSPKKRQKPDASPKKSCPSSPRQAKRIKVDKPEVLQTAKVEPPKPQAPVSTNNMTMDVSFKNLTPLQFQQVSDLAKSFV